MSTVAPRASYDTRGYTGVAFANAATGKLTVKLPADEDV
jgi:hypothetical protein